MSSLNAVIIPVHTVSESERAEMYGLYETYYDGSDPAIFQSDLALKDRVILLREPETGTIRGFSTLAVYVEHIGNQPVQVLYSGDTIIHRDYWGQNPFAQTWLRFAGTLHDDSPETPLYWLLIVKGHRTYRYLNLFAHEYYPHYDVPTPPEIQQLMDHLARQRFGNAYDSTDGIIRFPEPRSYLRRDLAEIPVKDVSRPEVRYFLSRNPNYNEGDELLCLCRLEPSNLTRFARQWFLEGAQRQAKDSRFHSLTNAMP